MQILHCNFSISKKLLLTKCPSPIPTSPSPKLFPNPESNLVPETAPVPGLGPVASLYNVFSRSLCRPASIEFETRLCSATIETRKETSDRRLKARNPDLYYGNSHLEYYLFVQQCELHFTTARVKSQKHMYFAPFFLKNRVMA